MVIVRVGPTSEKYTVHKTIIRNLGGYFSAALEGTRFIEGNTNRLTLPEESSKVFDRVLIYAYTEDFRSDGETDMDIDWTTLIDVHDFGERHIIPKMQNKAIALFAAKLDWDDNHVIPPEFLHHLYKKTKEDSPLRSLAIDAYAWNLRVESGKPTSKRSLATEERGSLYILEQTSAHLFPSGFVCEVLKEIARKAPTLRYPRTFGSIYGEYFVEEM